MVGRSTVSLRGGCERLWWWWWEVGGGGGDGRSKGLCVDRFSRSLKQIELYSRLVVVVGRKTCYYTVAANAFVVAVVEVVVVVVEVKDCVG